MAREGSLQETLVSAFENQMAGIHTAIPAVVVTVINELHYQTVDVQPSINIKFKNGEVAQRPPILNVPLIFPCSSTSAITFPVKKGDTVLLVFSMRGMDIFKAGDGKPATPSDYRKYDQRDAIAIPGLMPSNRSSNDPAKRSWVHDTQDTVIAHNIGTAGEVEVRLKSSGDVEINSSKNVIVKCDTAQVVASTSVSINTPVLDIDAATTNWYGTFNLYGPLNHSGNYASTGGTSTFNGVVFDSHVHGSSPGPSNP